MYINKGNFFFKNTQQYILNSVQIPWGVEIKDGGQPSRSRHLGLSIKGIVPLHVSFCILAESLFNVNLASLFRIRSSQLVYKFICQYY